MNSTPTVVLINPPRHNPTDPYDFGGGAPSLGLAYLAAELIAAGYFPLCIDAKYEKISYDQLENRIQIIEDIGVVGITAMTHNIEDAHDTAIIIKRHHPAAKVIIGGCHATALPKDTLDEFPYFDIAVIGEGEKTLPELMGVLRYGHGLEDVKGIVYRLGARLVETEARPPIEDLDGLPFPAWHLFPNVQGEIPILASRGCPFKCNFCMRVLGSRVRFRSPENVIQEIEYLIGNYAISELSFQDETFTLKKKRMKHLLRLMIENEIPQKVLWTISTRVDAVDREMLVLMKQAGCVRIGYGIETGNPEILKRSGKGTTLEQAKHAIKLTRSAGLMVSTCFIIGHPNETVKTAMDTIRFAAHINPDTLVFGIMVPYPGTEIREMVLKGEGGYHLIASDWRSYGKNVGHPIELDTLSRKRIMQLQLFGYFYFYATRFRWLDFVKLFLGNRKTIISILIAYAKQITGGRGVATGRSA